MKRRVNKKDRKFKKANFSVEVATLKHLDKVCAEKECSRGVLLEKMLNLVNIASL